MNNKKNIPVSIVIPTLGNKIIYKTLYKINKSSHNPNEILIIIPKKNPKGLQKLNELKLKYKNLRIRIITSKKKNQVHQRIVGFKKSKNEFILQLDDDIEIDKNCLFLLYSFIKKNKKSAVSPKYKNRIKLSSIYKKPNNLLLKTYHWLINSSKGYDPGNISLCGFNYSDESKNSGYKIHQWLSGGAVMHHKKNLILYNYYPYNFKKSYCEDILHSLLLNRKNINLFKYYDAKVSTKDRGNIIKNHSIKEILKEFSNEFLIRRYIVRKFDLSQTRLFIYYSIFFLRIIRKIIK